MRLVCPNCEAKYEVPEDAIPDTGRDVQCASCGHAWYQMRGRSGAALPLTAEPAPATEEPVPEQAPVMADAVAPEVAVAPEDAVVPVEVMPSESPEIETSPVAENATAETSVEQADLDDVLPEIAVAEAVEAETSVEAVVEDAMTAEQDAVVVPSEVSADVDPALEPETAIEVVAGAASDMVADLAPALDPEPEDETTPVDTPFDIPVGSLIEETPGEADDDAFSEPVAETETEPEAAPVAAAAVAAYAVDESVLAILREEAEREANARRAEALQIQTDLGIDAAVRGKTAEPAKVPAGAAAAEAKPSARRDLLPDVEEINSTLRPSEAALGDEATPDFLAPPPQAPRGFRSGFLSLMTIAILAAALYIVSPRLATMVPALAGPLESYVSIVDSLRLGLDGMMRSATVAINGD